MNELPPPTILRMIDANANRAREALRVMEDYCRFGLNDAGLSGELKGMRHGLAEAVGGLPMVDAVLARDTAEDVGTTIKTARELSRDSLSSVVIAAGKRLSESLRVLEECCKTISPGAAAAIEKLRYRGYVMEQTLSRFAGGADLRTRFGQVRLYVLLTESLCHASVGGWEKMLDAILGAGRGVCVQLREKGLSDGELLRRARILVAKCRRVGAISIINDRVDMAMAAGADGVHLGQTDLPCAEVRKLAGQQLIIGVSTENLGQARQAVRDGATYVGVGPMFATTTKEKPHLAGPAYAADAVRELGSTIPLVAIGGITAGNVSSLTGAGVRTVAVCAAIISQSDPAGAVRELLKALE